MNLKKGHLFQGPGEQAYRLTRDLVQGDVITLDLFEPIGGAPDAIQDHQMVPWLAEELQRLSGDRFLG